MFEVIASAYVLILCPQFAHKIRKLVTETVITRGLLPLVYKGFVTGPH